MNDFFDGLAHGTADGFGCVVLMAAAIFFLLSVVGTVATSCSP